MPKLNKNLSFEPKKVVYHPNSRKAAKLSKHIHRVATREKSKLVHSMKVNLLGEKLLWFRDNLDPYALVYTPELVLQLIEKYLHRFDEELEQIQLKRSIGKRKGNQHVSRQDTIQFTKKREKEEFETCGIECPDLLHPKHLQMLRDWGGELRYLQNFKLQRYRRRDLMSAMKNENKEEKSETPVLDNESDNVSTSECDSEEDGEISEKCDSKDKGEISEKCDSKDKGEISEKCDSKDKGEISEKSDSVQKGEILKKDNGVETMDVDV